MVLVRLRMVIASALQGGTSPLYELRIPETIAKRAGVSSATINGTFCTRYLARSARRRRTTRPVTSNNASYGN